MLVSALSLKSPFEQERVQIQKIEIAPAVAAGCSLPPDVVAEGSAGGKDRRIFAASERSSDGCETGSQRRCGQLLLKRRQLFRQILVCALLAQQPCQLRQLALHCVG